MNRKNFLFKTATLVLLLANGAFINNANAQVTIGDNKSPESFSLLELVGNGTKGLRLPQMTTEQRDAMANATFRASTLSMGLRIFNTTSKCVETWNGAVWIEQCAPVLDYIDVCNNGIKWATCNVDAFGTFAVNPEDAGMFYQWNRPTAWNTTDATVTGWDTSYPTGTTWETVNDPCPAGWRVPTSTEIQSLIDCGSIWTTQNGVNGQLFGTAPNQIFLPAVGQRYLNDGILQKTGTHGQYWSNIEALYENDNANYLFFSYNYSAELGDNPKTYGISVRCVKK